MKLFRTILSTMILVFAVGTAAWAQEKTVVWMAFSTVNSGMMDDAVAFTLGDSGFYDGLMADGTILDWGLATRATHLPDDPNNFVQWVVLPNWASVDPWVGGAVAMMRSRSEEETAALQEKAEKIFAAGSHHDVVAEATSWFGRPDAAVRYVYVGEFYAHPGKEAEMTALYNEAIPPIGKKLIDEGHLAGFGVHRPNLHTGDGWTHTFYYMLTGLEALDRFNAEVAKIMTPEFAERATAAHDLGRHRDSLWVVLHHGGASGDGDGEE